MTRDSGSGSTPRRYPRLKPPPMKFRDASDPIYSNPTVIGFVPSRKSSPDSETPEPGKPSSDSPEPGKGAEPVPFLKASDKTRKKLEGWLIFSPRGSSQSTGNSPQNSDSPEKPSSASPEHSTGKED